MTASDDWRAIAASALDWEQAHVTLDKAVAGLAPELRGRRPPNAPHSVWELVEHIRLSQRDLLDFMRDPGYEERAWPDTYWPPTPAPASDDEWNASLRQIIEDRAALIDFTRSAAVDFTARIPHGTGQTYLRTSLVAVDHTAYHVGQIVLVRRLLKDWG